MPDITLPFTFMINDDKIDDLKAMAREADDENNGQHQTEYTVEQAFIVAFQDASNWNRLMGPDKPLVGYHHADAFPAQDSVVWEGAE